MEQDHEQDDLQRSIKEIDLRLSTLQSREGGTGSAAVLVKKEPSPFDQHKRSRSSQGARDPMVTLQKSLQELAQSTNSYAVKGAFVKQFKERLSLLEAMTKKCEAVLAENSSRKRQEEEEAYVEKMRFVEGHASQLRKREEALATREAELAALRA